MGDKRQKNQLQMVLAFAVEGRSEAPKARREGTLPTTPSSSAVTHFNCLWLAPVPSLSSHQLDGQLHVYRGPQRLLTIQRPLRELIEPKPAIRTSTQKRKPKPPQIYAYSGRPRARRYSVNL